ncbi:protein kinase [candidate division KSB1 bacterium]|nr:protein kinase [candidate division KSB1 bacterium]
MLDLTGTTISNYRIIEKLGQGGMGVVYKAQDTRLRRHVAIKILIPEVTADAKLYRHFINEAQTASALNHPNICTIYDIGQYRKMNFIIMELVEGATLRQIQTQRGPLPEEEVIDIVSKICRALAVVHEKAILHHDIKPENVMISKHGFLKVMDFGLAKLATEAAELVGKREFAKQARPKKKSWKEKYAEGVVLTSLSGLLGTVHYMSPEQVQGKPLDQRSDIFSLGVVLYELATGNHPFEGTSNVTILAKIIHEAPELMPLISGHVSPALQELVNRCLAKDPGDRFQSAAELLQALNSLAAPKAISEKIGSSPGRGVKPEAYANYLKGMFSFENFTPMNVQKSMEFFKNAISDDPDFVEAYIGLARTMSHLGMTSWMPPSEAFSEAWTAVKRALELEPENGDAIAILGLIKFQTEFDWTGAEALFKQAMQRHPDSVMVLDAYTFYLTCTARHEEAIQHGKYCWGKMHQVYYYNLRLGWTYFIARRYDEAIAQLRETQVHFPELVFADILLAWCYARKGMYTQALAECAKAETKGMPPWQSSWIFAQAGKTVEARALLEELLKQNIGDELSLVLAYAALGETELVFEHLERAYERRLPYFYLVFLKVIPEFDVLRSDPRYFDLLKRIGLDE